MEGTKPRMIRTLICLFFCIQFGFLKGQSIERIDSLRNHTLSNLDQYECIEYFNERILNDDAVGYDSVNFYHKKNGQLVYMNWRDRSHYYDIQGDGIRISEIFLLNDSTVFRKVTSFIYENAKWHEESDQNKVLVRTNEHIREYYKENGSALGEFKGRKAQGQFKNRWTLLDSIPLELKIKRRWSDRCNECLSKDYLNLYQKLWKQQKPE